MSVYIIKEKEYPRLLKKIAKDAPKQLYYKGNWNSKIFENCLAVVGSRQMTTYGKRVVEQIVTEIAAAGITIVSGFMYGVDATAHKAALRAGGQTIAVMPCGINLIHPEYQKNLYTEILNNKGLIISEYEGDLLPALWTYPRRNRIVAGLSKAALIIEAKPKSGSLITATFAKKYKRKVFAVPGSITSENSKGTLQLIREGATMVTSAKDILDFYRFKNQGILSRSSFELNKLPEFSKKTKSQKETKSLCLPERSEGLKRDLSLCLPERSEGLKRDLSLCLEKKILSHLQREPLGIDELARTFEISASKLGTSLSLMQLKGLIQEDGGKYYLY